MTWSLNAVWVHTQTVRSLRTINREQEVSELALHVVVHLAAHGKAMRTTILDTIIGALGHAFNILLNESND